MNTGIQDAANLCWKIAAVERGSHRSVGDLESAIREFIVAHNQRPKPFHWTKSADQILASIARFATSTLADHRPYTYARNH